MIVVMNRIPVKPEFAQRIEDGFAKSAPRLPEMNGFQGFRLLRPTKDGDPYVVYVAWDTQEDHRAYMDSELFKESHSNMAGLANAFTGPPSLEIYEVAQEVQAP